MAPHSVSYISEGDYPNVIQDGMLELFKVIQGFEDGAAPSVQYLSELLLPSVRAMAAPLSTINAGQLLDTALGSVRGRSGAVTLRLAGSEGGPATPSSAKPTADPTRPASSSTTPAAPSRRTAPSSTPAQPR